MEDHRTSRALDRLRQFFARCGVVVGAATLGETLTARAVQPSPPGLLARVSARSLHREATLDTSIAKLVELTMKSNLWSRLKWYGAALGAVSVSLALLSLKAWAQQAGWPDQAFNPTNSFAPANAILPQADGRVLVAGIFASTVGNESTDIPRGIVRLDADGTRDSSFAAFDEDIMTAVLQSDGKVIVGGAWRQTNAVKRANISRLNSDGTLDATFDPGPGTDWDPNSRTVRKYVSWLVLQPDGRILVSGTFTNIAGQSRPGLARLHPDGSLDESFLPKAFPGDAFGRPLLQPDGRIIAWAGSSSASGVVTPHYVRLNENGALDTSFEPSRRNSRNSRDPNYLLALQSSGKSLGWVLNGAPTPLIRLNPDGTRDTNFAPRIERRGDPAGSVVTIDAISVDSADRIIVAGRFTRVNAVERRGLCRLNPDGSLDTTFAVGAGFEPLDLAAVRAITFDADGRVLVGGTPYVTYQGFRQAGILRIWADPQLRLGALTRTDDGHWLATVISRLSQDVQVEASTDLIQWTPEVVITNALGIHVYIEPMGNSAARFFRARTR